MQKMIRIVMAVLLAGLTACSTPQLDNAKCGFAPVDAEHQTRLFFDSTLRDPESARYQFGGLVKGWAKEGLVRGGKVHFGWVQIVDVNAKNGFGGYTGFQRHYLFFSNGRLQSDITMLMNNGFGMAGIARE